MPNSPHASNQTTHIKALNEIRSKIKEASGRRVHIYAFNIHPDQLKSAYDLLDKAEQRRAMRVTYSDDHNFIVRYMPGAVHEETCWSWAAALSFALTELTPPPHTFMAPGCAACGTTTFELGPRQKQADAGIRPIPSRLPSVVLEVGDSESLTQLKIDAKLWLEHMPEVQLVILLSISPPIAPHLDLPRIIIQLWRGYPPRNPPRTAAARARQARMAWEANWTHEATLLYILLSDIFRGPAPAVYGDNDRVYLDTVTWRQAIINAY
ncbi:hypothetical protein F5887DRAFT_878335 [Amanita rubescens]|nr:hypothetical protein F5887DRAFT_878335 [Amanita rubescens]